jgi:hypothetical protein
MPRHARSHARRLRPVSERKHRKLRAFMAVRFFSCVAAPKFLWTTMACIEKNPVRADIVREAEQYCWSSAMSHITGTDRGPVSSDGGMAPKIYASAMDNVRSTWMPKRLASGFERLRCTAAHSGTKRSRRIWNQYWDGGTLQTRSAVRGNRPNLPNLTSRLNSNGNCVYFEKSRHRRMLRVTCEPPELDIA